MNKNFFGTRPVAFLATLMVMLALVSTAAIKLVLTNQERDTVGRSIRAKETEREALQKEINKNARLIARYTERISLRNELDKRMAAARVSTPFSRITEDQVIKIPASPVQLSLKTQPVESTSFGVAQLAFSTSVPGRGQPRQ